jgi:hypothetical protein
VTCILIRRSVRLHNAGIFTDIKWKKTWFPDVLITHHSKIVAKNDHQAMIRVVVRHYSSQRLCVWLLRTVAIHRTVVAAFAAAESGLQLACHTSAMVQS